MTNYDQLPSPKAYLASLISLDMKNGQIYFTMAILICAMGCNEHVAPLSLDIEKDKILAVRDSHRLAHFNKDAESFVSTFADDFISVNRGAVKSSGRDENIERFQSYFDAVEFRKWDDLNEPLIRFSDDGKLAYVVTEKQVDLTYPGTEGETYLDQTTYAWVSIFRKTDQGWKVECIASTNTEPTNEVIEE